MKSIIIIGSGMGGSAAGIHGQRNGFGTIIFEAHNLPGGNAQVGAVTGTFLMAVCTILGGGSPQIRVEAFWRESGGGKHENDSDCVAGLHFGVLCDC